MPLLANNHVVSVARMVLVSLVLSCSPARERPRSVMPTDKEPFERLTATLADGEKHALPVIDYCMHAFATTTADRPELRWAGPPPTVAPDRLLLLLGPAMRNCAFVGGAGGPRVDHVVRRGTDVVVHVGFPAPFDLSWAAAHVPRPPPDGRLLLVVHGSIMGPPGDWNDAREHVVPIAR